MNTLDVHYDRMGTRREAAKSCANMIRDMLSIIREDAAASIPKKKNLTEHVAGGKVEKKHRKQRQGKVQAQRKFAQGAIVPPSTSAPERRRDVTPKEEQSQPLGTNTMVKMPAKSLLDVVAFKNMHNHFQPFVLLKRLPESSAENGPQAAQKEKPSENNSAQGSTAGLIKRHARAKTMPSLKTKTVHTMKLRSRQIKRASPQQIKTFTKKSQNQSSSVKAKRRRVIQPSVSDFSVDDNKPLTYFSKRRKTPVISTKSRASGRPPGRPAKRRIDAIIPFDLPTPDAVQTEIPIISTGPMIDLSIAYHGRPLSDREVACVANNETPITLDIEQNITDNRLAPVDGEQDGPYYSSSQIARWVDTCTQTVTPTNEVSTDMFKTPLPPPPPIARRIEQPSLDIETDPKDEITSILSDDSIDPNADNISIPECATPVSLHPDCVSHKYMTVGEVLTAPKEEIETRCNRCRGCEIVDKVFNLSALVSSALDDNMVLEEDIYHFKAANILLTNPEYRLCLQKSSRSNRDCDTESDSSSINGGESFYVNVLPESTHIMLVLSVKTSNTFLGSKLVPKSQADTNNELSLTEHESLLDQVMTNLLCIRSREINNRTEPLPKIKQEPLSVQPKAKPVDQSTNGSASRSRPPRSSSRLQQKNVSKERPANVVPSTSRFANGIDHMPSTSGCTPARSQETDYRSPSVVSAVTDSQTVDPEPLQEDFDAQSCRVYPTANPYINCRIQNSFTMQTRDSQDTAPKPIRRETRNTDSSKANQKRPKLVDAPVFRPTAAEFRDPIKYYEKILPTALKYGLCKIIPPPNFKPKCVSNDDLRFTVMNQYVARMYNRWGPAQREMSAIKAHLHSQGVLFSRAPLLDYMEVDLPKLFHVMQHNGGLTKVIEKKRWSRVANDLHNNRCISPGRKLDFIYVKYLLPYGTLTNVERQEMMRKVDRCWFKKNQKLLDRALNPLHKQKKLLGESDSSADEEDEHGEHVNFALSEAEDCVVLGRNMNLTMFKRTASNMKTVRYPATGRAKLETLEAEYWKIVLLGTDHVCVNTASIDTGQEGYGFTKNKQEPFGKHPWNLKVLTQNSNNVLRGLGDVIGVTVPTLHLGMLYSTSCWHRDPHGLPWIEYMHSGPKKIWYGIPDHESGNFRTAVEKLCPMACQNKGIWLPSDITMIPPELLCEHNVSLSRVTQEPGEYILVFPKAYSCSISTGYTQSESVYFAPHSWLDDVKQIFEEAHKSCEPTMFALEQLLMGLAKDRNLPMADLRKVHKILEPILQLELKFRGRLNKMGVKSTNIESRSTKTKTGRRARALNTRLEDECEVCRTTLYLSMVTNTTGKRMCICLEHALKMFELPKNSDLSIYELVLLISSNEIQNLLTKLRKKLAS